MKPSKATQRAVAAYIAAAGSLHAAAKKLGVSRHALAQIAGGLEVREGTIALVEQKLGKK